ncbi:hypothetical protein GBA63_12520 [Rubrobacter tropicus]|uniref:Uncharacterized protein n=1 Tax=Rubrobacter tropicus TaxID=2653851 RepID=A0A6G8QAB4_9ACTN|nr:hypothetical protein [Rubrobacter tropicus]QIN83368.1 hypothetical protein GBA63_12520 [Rubrobacter tropicus]
MSVETPASLFRTLPANLQKMGRWLRRGSAAENDPPGSRRFLTQEQFQEELVVIGLSDQPFGPMQYAGALGRYLGLTISVDIIPDTAHPLLSRELARKGVTGEIRYRADLDRAHVIVPGSLPPFALAFTLLHELGHLAAGDLFVDPCDVDLLSVTSPFLPTLEVPHKKRLARGLPFARIGDREHEADLRAGYAFVAGCLGSENPYAQRMYDIL